MNMKEPLIKANRVFKYSITFQKTDEESRELSDFSDSGFIIENETDEIGDILKLAQERYGIYYPIAFGGWESTYPDQNVEWFTKGIETYYALFIKNEDGTDITEEENDFITFLLSDGNYNKSEFTDYAVGGLVAGALALGVGGLIAYYYFNKRKKGYPTGSAWTKEHYHDNEDEDYEVEPSKRKIPARNRKFVNGGGVEKGYNVFNYTDNVYATDEVFKTKRLANEFIKEFRNRFLRQGYYRDNQMNKIAIEDIDLLAIPSDFSPFRKFDNGGGVGSFSVGDKVIFNQDPSGKLSENIYYGTILEINNGVAKIDHINSNMKNVIRNVRVENLQKYSDGGGVSSFNVGGGVSKSHYYIILKEGLTITNELDSSTFKTGIQYSNWGITAEQYEKLKNRETITIKGGNVSWEWKFKVTRDMVERIREVKTNDVNFHNGGGVGSFIVGDKVRFNQDPSGKLSENIYYGTILEINNGVAKIDHINSNMKNVIRNVRVENLQKYAGGGTTTTRPTTTPEVVPDTDTKPKKPKTPFQPKHIPKPKARKYDFILIK